MPTTTHHTMILIPIQSTSHLAITLHTTPQYTERHLTAPAVATEYETNMKMYSHTDQKRQDHILRSKHLATNVFLNKFRSTTTLMQPDMLVMTVML